MKSLISFELTEVDCALIPKEALLVIITLALKRFDSLNVLFEISLIFQRFYDDTI